MEIRPTTARSIYLKFKESNTLFEKKEDRVRREIEEDFKREQDRQRPEEDNLPNE